MEIVPIDRVNIDAVIDILANGGLVIYPTETMYGAGVDATNPTGIAKMIKYKNRPLGKPFSITVCSREMAEKYVKLNQTARNLYRRFLPGPMTVISRVKEQKRTNRRTENGKVRVEMLAEGVASETGTIGIRIPDYKFVTDLVCAFGKPITATSANSSYKKRPYKIADILDNISGKQKSLIDLIIDAGELPHNEPSTVIDTTADDTVVLRQGDLVVGGQAAVVSRSEEDTKNTAKELWQKFEKHSGQRAIVFALEGEMGSGKTQFTKGLAKAMGIEENIVSPTYNLEIQYKTPIQNFLNHIDAWRMQDPEELEALGLTKMIKDKSVLAIEWADKVADVIRKHNEDAVIIWVKIGYGKKDQERLISWRTL